MKKTVWVKTPESAASNAAAFVRAEVVDEIDAAVVEVIRNPFNGCVKIGVLWWEFNSHSGD